MAMVTTARPAARPTKVASTTMLVSRARTIARRRRGTSRLSSYGSFKKGDILKMQYRSVGVAGASRQTAKKEQCSFSCHDGARAGAKRYDKPRLALTERQ